MYYSTQTVGTCSDFPRFGKTQLFRHNVSYSDLRKLFQMAPAPVSDQHITEAQKLAEEYNTDKSYGGTRVIPKAVTAVSPIIHAPALVPREPDAPVGGEPIDQKRAVPQEVVV